MSQISDISRVSTGEKHDVFCRQLTDILGVQQKEMVKGSDRLSSLKGWDSLTILEVMSLADSAYRVDLDPERIARCQTVDDLTRLVLSGGE